MLKMDAELVLRKPLSAWRGARGVAIAIARKGLHAKLGARAE